MDRPTCKTCPYYVSSGEVGGEGQCQRHPPRFISCEYEGAEDEPANTGYWPLVTETGFCGEHPDFPAYLASLRPEPAFRESTEEEIAELRRHHPI
jgi:hypothetical protein